MADEAGEAKPKLQRTHNIDETAIYDLDEEYIKDAAAFHAYVRATIKHPDEENVKYMVMELSGAVAVYLIAETPEPEANHRLFEGNFDLGKSASERHDPIEDKRWKLREDLDLKTFMEELKVLVKQSLDRPEMKERGASWEHPWDPAFYNCQHFAGDVLTVAAPGVEKFYKECLMHKPSHLKLDTGIGLFGSKLAAKLSQGVMKDKQPDLDEWTDLFKDTKPGPEWKIINIEMYWRDCTVYAAAITKAQDRLTDHSQMHQKMKEYRKRLVLEQSKTLDSLDEGGKCVICGTGCALM